jgi:hypothetical protein
VIACKDCAFCEDAICYHPLATLPAFDFLNGVDASTYMTPEQARQGFCGFNAVYFHPLDAAGVMINAALP